MTYKRLFEKFIKQLEDKDFFFRLDAMHELWKLRFNILKEAINDLDIKNTKLSEEKIIESVNEKLEPYQKELEGVTKNLLRMMNDDPNYDVQLCATFVLRHFSAKEVIEALVHVAASDIIDHIKAHIALCSLYFINPMIAVQKIIFFRSNSEALEKMVQEKMDLSWNEFFQNKLQKNGYFFAQKGEFSRAQKFLEKAAYISHENPEAWVDLGSIYLELGDIAKCKENLSKAHELDPTFGGYWRVMGHINQMNKEYNQAINNYKKAIELNSEDLAAWQKLGEMYILVQKFQEALDCLKESMKLESESFFTWYLLGVAYYYLRKREQAIEALEYSIELKEDFKRTWMALSNIYKEMNDIKNAERCRKILENLDYR
ncbi:tetratricopeptide repeat protein [Candidatus Heimdallarchaeota archaeon]|nr:MAG: tetratricopeptide repeat protein [Candidatus Heimdallarchaeota archaeon]